MAASQVVRVLLRTPLEFNNVAASSTLVVPLVGRIPVAQYKNVIMNVKLLSVTIGSGATVAFKAIPDASTDFVIVTDPNNPLATVTLTSTSAANAPYSAQLDATKIPAMIGIWVYATQPGSQQTIKVEIEIELIMREQ